MILEKLNLVPGRSQHCESEFRPRYPGDLAREVACVMRPMRELESQDIAPESERSLEVRDSDAGMIGGDNVKRLGTHFVNGSRKTALEAIS